VAKAYPEEGTPESVSASWQGIDVWIVPFNSVYPEQVHLFLDKGERLLVGEWRGGVNKINHSCLTYDLATGKLLREANFDVVKFKFRDWGPHFGGQEGRRAGAASRPFCGLASWKRLCQDAVSQVRCQDTRAR
jgi:hypothetical protein